MAAELRFAFDSTDEEHLRREIERAAEALREGSVAVEDAAHIVQAFADLARHESPNVRKDIAFALQYVRADRAIAILDLLCGDDHSMVFEAAERTREQKTRQAPVDYLLDEHGELLERWFREVGPKLGARERTGAVQVVNRYVELVLYEVQHELAKVTSPLELQVQGMRGALRDDDVKRAVAMLRDVERNVGRLAGMVNELTEVSRPLGPTFAIEPLAPILEESVRLVRERKRKKKIPPVTVSVECPADLEVEVDHRLLVTALTNIVDNAYEALADRKKAKRRIEIEGSRRERSASVHIRDTGRGMTEGGRKMAFRLYYTTKKGGKGAGLTQARRILVSGHHGSIALDTERDAGTTVLITLPLRQPRGES